MFKLIVYVYLLLFMIRITKIIQISIINIHTYNVYILVYIEAKLNRPNWSFVQYGHFKGISILAMDFSIWIFFQSPKSSIRPTKELAWFFIWWWWWFIWWVFHELFCLYARHFLLFSQCAANIRNTPQILQNKLVWPIARVLYWLNFRLTFDIFKIKIIPR